MKLLEQRMLLLTQADEDLDTPTFLAGFVVSGLEGTEPM